MDKNDRLYQVVELLLDYMTYLPILEIAKYFHVSRKTIYNDLAEINYALEKAGVDNVEVRRNKGVLLTESQRVFLSEYLLKVQTKLPLILNREERLSLIYCLIYASQRNVTVDAILEILDASRNTIFSDIRAIKNELAEFGVFLKYSTQENRYYLEGDELKLRAFLMQSLGYSNIIEFGYLFYDLEVYQENLNKIIEIERELGIEYTKGTVELLAAILSIPNKTDIGRLEGIDKIKNSTIHRQVQLVFDKFPENEQVYISMQLMGYRTQFLSSTVEDTYQKTAEVIAREMIVRFTQLFAVEVNDDDLYMQLVSHLRISIHRYIYGIMIQNPLYKEIKENYNNIYFITDVICDVIREHLQVPISSSEVSFITIIFGGYLRRNAYRNVSYDIIVVCPNGYSTAILLKNEIENLDPSYRVVEVHSVRTFKKNQTPYDIIISTVDLDAVDHILVNPVLTKRDKDVIINRIPPLGIKHDFSLSLDSILEVVLPYIKEEDVPCLREDLTKLFELKVIDNVPNISLKAILQHENICWIRSHNWQEAIAEVASYLTAGTIEQEYVSEMIESVETFGPYIVINETFALAHAQPGPSVHRLGVSIGISKEPIKLMTRQFQCLIILAVIDKTSHLQIMRDLMTFIQDEGVLSKMISAASLDDSRKIFFDEVI